MNISLLSGAYKNAGDFLIVDRCKKLLKYVYPECNIIEYERRNPLNDYLDTINKSDCLIFAGGPAYVSNIYPNRIPLVEDLTRIKVPFFTIGLGWRGANVNNREIYNFKFSNSTLNLWKRIENDGLPLSCRDYFSQRVLNSCGIKRTEMTGCPAWYNLDAIMGKEVIQKKDKVCISDPAFLSNFSNTLRLAEIIKERFNNHQIIFVFHRGFASDKFTESNVGELQKQLKQKIESLGIEVKDISYGYDGMKIYDDCSLHIGFRVHAHIYNISRGNQSILIDEDSRGKGFNCIFALPEIDVCRESVFQNRYLRFAANKAAKLIRIQSDFFENQLFDALDLSQNWMYENAFSQIKNVYFKRMTEHLKKINNLI